MSTHATQLLRSLPREVQRLNFSEFDVVANPLCQGGFGTVYRANVKNAGGLRDPLPANAKKAALKFFGYVADESKYKPAPEPNDEAIATEIDLMYRMKGLPGVSELYGVFADTERGFMPFKNPRFLKPYMTIAMELIEGGDLFSRISSMIQSETQGGKIVNLSESYLANIFKSIIKGLQGIHGRNYIHCDIKMENIMLLKNDKSCADIKLVDFGTMQSIDPVTKKKKISHGALGTPGYFAPESLHRNEYSVKSDVWQCGCALYTMLCGSYIPDKYQEIFKDSHNAVKAIDDFYRSYKKVPGDYDYFLFPQQDWSIVSTTGKDLVRKMLEPDVDKRLTMDEVLRHPWLNDRAPTHKLTHEYGTRIKRLALRKRLKKVFEARIGNIVVMDDAAAEVEARKIFDEMDEDGNGTITKSELIVGVKRMVSAGSFDEKETNDAFEAIDINRDGYIDFEEFLEFHKIIISATTTLSGGSDVSYSIPTNVLGESFVHYLLGISWGIFTYSVFLLIYVSLIPAFILVIVNHSYFRTSYPNFANYLLLVGFFSLFINYTNWSIFTKYIYPYWIELFNTKTNISPHMFSQYIEKDNMTVIHSQNLSFYSGAIFGSIVKGKSPCEAASSDFYCGLVRSKVDDALLTQYIRQAIASESTIIPCVAFKSPHYVTLPFLTEMHYCFGDPIPTSGLAKPEIKRLPSASASTTLISRVSTTQQSQGARSPSVRRSSSSSGVKSNATPVVYSSPVIGDGEPSIRISDEVIQSVLKRYKMNHSKLFHANKFRIGLAPSSHESTLDT